MAWGFADHSLRVGHYDNEKAVFVCESVVQNSGEIVACVSPSPKLIVTAGTSSVSIPKAIVFVSDLIQVLGVIGLVRKG